MPILYVTSKSIGTITLNVMMRSCHNMNLAAILKARWPRLLLGVWKMFEIRIQAVARARRGRGWKTRNHNMARFELECRFWNEESGWKIESKNERKI